MTAVYGSNSDFPLDDMQEAYFVGEQAGLPLSTRARYYRELDTDPFPPQAVQDAWNRIVRRHDMLRAVILPSGLQRVLDPVADYRIACADLSAVSEEERERARSKIRARMLETSLPLDRWPQFAIEASRGPESLRLHIRFNLWVIDAISVQIILSELVQLCRNPAVELPAPATTFRDCIEARVAARGRPAAAAAHAYWRERAATLPLGPELPLRCTAEEVRDPAFSHLSASLPAEEWQRFMDNANAHRVSPAFALMSVYARTLARWSKRGHFTITTLLSKRPFAEGDVSNVVGNFGTTLLLEVDGRQRQPFKHFAQQLQKQFWRDARHLSMSGVEVSREVGRLRQIPLGPITPVTFTSSMMNDTLSEEGKAALSRIRHVGSHLDVPQVHLDHQIAVEPQGHLTVNWDWVRALFHDGVVEDMFAGYLHLLKALAADPAAWTGDAPVPLPEPQRRLLADYNATTRACPDLRLDDLMAEHVARRPGHTAVVNGGVRLSYGELDTRAGALARVLAGVLAGRRREGSPLVAVALPKGWEQIVAVLGIIRCGGAYVPIDPDLPALRKAQLLAQSEAAVVVTSAALAATADWTGEAEVVRIDALPDAGPTALPERADLAATDTAYVIFTSGSTGTPKGVVVDHRGAVNTILDINRRIAPGVDDRVLALSSLSFDLSVYDIFGTLAAGGTIVIPAPAEQLDPQAWCRLVADEGVTVWNSVPALFQLATDTALQTKTSLPGLRAVLLSGDWIPRQLPAQGRTIAPAARIFSLGGATEASIWSVIHEIGDLDASWNTIPYGRPQDNQTLHILNERLEPCPLWTVGEIHIGGTGVARGYLHDERRTRERFITHPDTGERLYRTGDLGRMRPCGNIEFLGREDHQIKIRGFRIELGEIEAAIVAQGSVSMAVVKVFGNTDAGKRLVAFAVPKPDERADAEEIRAGLAQALPRYMVPEVVHVLDAPPLSANGKIDHRALEALHAARTAPAGPGGDGAEDGPEDGIEAGVRQVWEQVLGCGRVDPSASFFDLGGTSFQALQVLAEIRERFATRLTLASFSSSLTVHGMAAQIRRQSGEDVPAPSLLRLKATPTGGPVSVFCVHPVGGSAHCYLPLAERLRPDVPVFGIQSSFPEPAAVEHPWRIEDLAERYLPLIQDAAPHGACALVGWSMGGAVAMEIARLLLASGRAPAFVALIDPYRAPPSGGTGMDALRLQLAFCRDLAGLAGVDLPAPDADGEARLARLDGEERFATLMRDLSRRGVLPEDPPVAELRAVHGVFAKNLSALIHYTPTVIETDVLVFRAATALGATHLVPWEPGARSLETHRMPCDHFDIMRPPVIDGIATILNRRIEAAGAA